MYVNNETHSTMIIETLRSLKYLGTDYAFGYESLDNDAKKMSIVAGYSASAEAVFRKISPEQREMLYERLRLLGVKRVINTDFWFIDFINDILVKGQASKYLVDAEIIAKFIDFND